LTTRKSRARIARTRLSAASSSPSTLTPRHRGHRTPPLPRPLVRAERWSPPHIHRHCPCEPPHTPYPCTTRASVHTSDNASIPTSRPKATRWARDKGQTTRQRRSCTRTHTSKMRPREPGRALYLYLYRREHVQLGPSSSVAPRPQPAPALPYLSLSLLSFAARKSRRVTELDSSKRRARSRGPTTSPTATACLCVLCLLPAWRRSPRRTYILLEELDSVPPRTWAHGAATLRSILRAYSLLFELRELR